MSEHLSYEVQERRQREIEEVCLTLASLIDPAKLQFEYAGDGETFAKASFHAVVTVLANGDKFYMRITHDSQAPLEFHVDPSWFAGSIHWIPLDRDVDIRDSFMTEWNRWSDAQWAARKPQPARVHRVRTVPHAA